MKDKGADVEMRDAPQKHETRDTESSIDDCGTPPQTVAAEPLIEYVGWAGLTRHEKYDMVGWVLFIFSAVFFLVAAIEWESVTSILGSLFFLVACFAFMIPMLWKEKQP